MNVGLCFTYFLEFLLSLYSLYYIFSTKWFFTTTTHRQLQLQIHYKYNMEYKIQGYLREYNMECKDTTGRMELHNNPVALTINLKSVPKWVSCETG